MMKNKMMRIASVLLVAVLLSTCAISGTFAKYVTSDNVNDEARVAKWGVKVTTTGSLFKGEYNVDATNDPANNDITLSVQTSDTQRLVAPGTKNEEGMAFSITGTPEVAVNVKIEIDYKDILLPDGIYDNFTTGAINDKFELTEDYYPVKFTLTHNGRTVKEGTLNEVSTYLTTNANHQAKVDLGNIYGNYTLTWKWAIVGKDEADTYLGNCAANSSLVTDDNGICIEEAFDITITVTQID